MKSKLFLTLWAATWLLCPALTRAQNTITNPAPAAAAPTNTLETALSALVQRVNAKISAGKSKEADFTDEIKAFDDLIAQTKGAKTEMAAQIAWSKMMLYLQVLNDTDTGKKMLIAIKANYPDTQPGIHVDMILAAIEKQAAAKKNQAALAKGDPFPDFSETDLAGKPLSVAAFKGKVVLVDFWATWCVPCMAELPDIIVMYKKYHADGFEVIGVNLDSSRGKIDAFLKEEPDMTWPQFFDGQGWGNKLAVKYGLTAIPFNILVGSDGKIIEVNLHGEDLKKAIVDALGKK